MAVSSSPDGPPQADTAPASPAGPYETEQEAFADCRNVYIDTYGSPGGLTAGNRDRLLAACEAAGVELGLHDRRILEWMAGWEPTTVQVLIGVISRARAGERRDDGITGGAQ